MSYNDKNPDMSAMYAIQFEYENKLKDKIKELETELERTRKALGIAKDTFNWIDETYRTGQETEAEIWGKVQLAAQEITALEQKDVK